MLLYLLSEMSLVLFALLISFQLSGSFLLPSLFDKLPDL